MMQIHAAYTAWATTYDQDRNLTRDLDAEITRNILPPIAGRTILELGCGTGKNTRFLAQIGEQVRAFDFSTGMLDQARAKLRAAQIPESQVTFTQTDITQPWSCPTAWADPIVCNLVLEHIRDLNFVFAEAARVLAPGGYFFVSELHPFRQYAGKQARFIHEGQTLEIPAYVHHISDFLEAAASQQLALTRLQEWWHTEDAAKLPRLVSFLWHKAS